MLVNARQCYRACHICLSDQGDRWKLLVSTVLPDRDNFTEITAVYIVQAALPNEDIHRSANNGQLLRISTSGTLANISLLSLTSVTTNRYKYCLAVNIASLFFTNLVPG